MLLSEGQMSDFGGAALMIDAFPKARSLLGDKGYDADWFREALADREIEACIPSKSNRKIHIPHDTVLYRQRHKIEIMSGLPDMTQQQKFSENVVLRSIFKRASHD